MKRTNTVVTISCSLILGLICGILRRIQMHFAYDASGLPVPGHITTMLLGAVTIVGALLLIALAIRAKGPVHASFCFSGQRIAPSINLAGGLLIAISGAAAIPHIQETYYASAGFFLVMDYFTILAGMCIVVQGMASLLGAIGGLKPTYILATFCIVGKIVLSYKEMSSDPVRKDVIFSLFASLLFVMSLSRMGGILFKDPRPRRILAYSLLGTLCCIVTAFEGHSFYYTLFYIGTGAVMVANSLAIMSALGKEPPKEEEEEPEEGQEDTDDPEDQPEEPEAAE